MPSMNSVAILIPYYEATDASEAHFKSLERLQENKALPESHIIGLDDASEDATTARLKTQKCFDIVATHQTNTDYTGAINDLVRIANDEFAPEVICILDQDSTILPSTLKKLCQIIRQDKDLGVLQPLALDDRDGVYSFGHRFNDAYMAHPIQRRHPAQSAPGQDIVERRSVTFIGTLVRTAVFRDIGLLEETYERYWESSDFCFRARESGWSVATTPSTTVVHDRYLDESTAWHLHYVYRNWILFWSRFNEQIAARIVDDLWPSNPSAVDVAGITPDVTPLDDRSFLRDARAEALKLRDQMQSTRPLGVTSDFSVETVIDRV
jgi:GT2 family glycosyltransferase